MENPSRLAANITAKPHTSWGSGLWRRVRAGGEQQTLTWKEVSEVLQTFGCFFFCIVGFLRHQALKTIHSHLGYENTNKNDLTVLPGVAGSRVWRRCTQSSLVRSSVGLWRGLWDTAAIWGEYSRPSALTWWHVSQRGSHLGNLLSYVLWGYNFAPAKRKEVARVFDMALMLSAQIVSRQLAMFRITTWQRLQ